MCKQGVLSTLPGRSLAFMFLGDWTWTQQLLKHAWLSIYWLISVLILNPGLLLAILPPHVIETSLGLLQEWVWSFATRILFFWQSKSLMIKLSQSPSNQKFLSYCYYCNVNNFTPIFLQQKMLLRTSTGFSSCNEKDFWGDQLGSLLVMKKTSREPNWVLSSCYEKRFSNVLLCWCLGLVTNITFNTNKVPWSTIPPFLPLQVYHQPLKHYFNMFTYDVLAWQIRQ